jgi:carboxylesterase type B
LSGATNNEGGLYELLGIASGQADQAKLIGTMASTMLACSPHAAVAARRKADVPAWRYYYQAGYPNQDIGITGAWHTSEIGPVFGTTEFISNITDTAEEKKLIETMQNAWTGFAKDPANALTKLGWPLYNDNGK